VYLKDGTFDDSDETYINKLNQSTINFIKKQKGVISSNVKLKSANKTKIFKLENNSQNKEIMKNNKIICIAKIGGNI
jgi:nicotinate-nucleotide pyrophosphorylase